MSSDRPDRIARAIIGVVMALGRVGTFLLSGSVVGLVVLTAFFVGAATFEQAAVMLLLMLVIEAEEVEDDE